MDNSQDTSQTPAEPTTPVEVTTPEVANEPTAPASTPAPADSTPTENGSASDAPAEAPSAPEAPAAAESAQTPTPDVAPAEPALGGRTDTSAGNTAPDPTKTVEVKAAGTPEQLVAQAKVNEGPVPGKLIVQKLEQELEDELDSGIHASIDDFVKVHWEAGDASVQRMAKVLRMDVPEVWQVVKDLGYKLPQGL